MTFVAIREYRHEYSRILRPFLEKKTRKKMLIFTIFVEKCSRKWTYFHENRQFRDIRDVRDYSRVFANITHIRARYSRPRIPYYSRRSANSAIFATPLCQIAIFLVFCIVFVMTKAIILYICIYVVTWSHPLKHYLHKIDTLLRTHIVARNASL